MGVIALAAVVLVALVTVLKPKDQQMGAMFAVGDNVHLSIATGEGVLVVLDRTLENNGWHYEVARRTDAFAMPGPGDFRATWWTDESNLAPWTGPG